MRTVNVVIFVCAAMATLQTLRLFRRGDTSIRSTVLWTVIWASIAVFGLLPHLLDWVMRWTMMQDRIVFLFVAAILIIYAMFFSQSNRQAVLERQVTRLAQELALLRFEQQDLASGGHASGADRAR